jgi:hypothetical protein
MAHILTRYIALWITLSNIQRCATTALDIKRHYRTADALWFAFRHTRSILCPRFLYAHTLPR